MLKRAPEAGENEQGTATKELETLEKDPGSPTTEELENHNKEFGKPSCSFF